MIGQSDNQRVVWVRAVVVGTAVVVATTSLAVLGDEPGVEYIFPAGGRRGTTVDFHVGGYNLQERCGFEMWGEGIAASDHLVRGERTVWFEGPLVRLPASQGKEDYPKDQAGHVQIAANAPLGWRRWRVWTSQGATASRQFVVGDLPEIVETEIDGQPIPTAVSLPVTINGRIFPREDLDIWTFEGRRGETYCCEVLASRIGSPLDSRILITGPAGQTIVENIDHFGNDSFAWFTAPADGKYTVQIHDINFGGLQHYVYRLTLRDGPFVEHLYPLGGRRGTAVSFELHGGGVPDEPVLLALPRNAAERLEEEITLAGRMTNRFLLESSDLPELFEPEPADTDDENFSLAPIPGVWNGRISAPGEVDMWRVELKKEQAVEFDVHAARLGSRLDSVLGVTNTSDETLASQEAFHHEDPRLVFTAPDDGVYQIQIRDRYSHRGGTGFAYRLYATAPKEQEAGYQLRFEQDALTLLRGGEIKTKVHADRIGGMNSPIQLSVDGLPPGVTVAGDTIATDQSELELTFSATQDAPLQRSHLKLNGVAVWNDVTLARTAVKPAVSEQDLEVDNVLLAVSLATPFKVVGDFETTFAARGSTRVRHYRLERGGYEGPLTIRMGDRQARHLQGVTGRTIVVPAGVDEFDYPIQLAPWMEIGRTSRTAVMAVGQLEEADGSFHEVSYTSLEQFDQIVVFVDPGQLAFQVAPRTLLASDPNDLLQLHVAVKRGQGITGLVTVELMVPEHIQGISATPLVLPADVADGNLSIVLADGPRGPFNMPLSVRATTHVNGHPYVAEAQVDFVAPADIAARD